MPSRLLDRPRLALALAALCLGALAATPPQAVAALAPASATPTASSAGQAVTAAPADAPGWTTLLRDDFTGPAGAPVGSQWEHEVGTWGTGAVDRTTASTANVFLTGGGALGIRALRDSAGAWTSGRIVTADKSFSAPAGGRLLMTASIQLPDVAQATGYWPAFWALGRDANAVIDWPATGEFDMLEAVNGTAQVIQTLHCGVPDGGPCDEPAGRTSGMLDCATCVTGFHRYSALLDRTVPGDERVEFLVDGVTRHVVRESEVGTAAWQAAVPNDVLLILNLAIGGGLPNGVCGCDSAAAPKSSGGTMLVDHVAVYRSDAAPAPVVVGTAAVGATLSSSAGRTGPLVHRWAAGGVDIAGVTGPDLVVPSSAVGKRVTVTVSAADGSGPTTSQPTAPVAAGTLGAAMPTVTGTARVGAVLTAAPGPWTPTPVNLTYRWKADGAAVAGATSPRFTLTKAQAGKRITLTVTGTKTGYTTASRTSAATAVVGR
ncbi:hypothetical protein C5C27_12070 [Rathayibacter sp. AY2B7]|uniref:family 16 glycosylhydrolase n=1 Tax=Rathayibacter sp. AY2B7 TaxID=2080571 RepID=UPI000CE7EEE7|nr:family 16 glycosylhydrolase [Rathayibacter sp. AY2B7]PPG56940.1 hypothetical protein C5C27_12070 [Rathayibacter sp. AY2B7]